MTMSRHEPDDGFLKQSHDFELARQIHALEERIVHDPRAVSTQLEALFYKDFRHAMRLLRSYRELCENDRSRSFITAIMQRMYTKYQEQPPPGYTDVPRSQQ
jgi:hypothetical protein